MKRVLSVFVIFLLSVSFFTSYASAAYDPNDTYSIISDLVYTYKMQQNSAYDEIHRMLSDLEILNPELGETYGKIMNYWSYANEDLTMNMGILPDGLPDDDSLCIVVLGFMLNSDGTMAEELIGRLETALKCAEKYPNAYIAVTGGGTAFKEPDATEAWRMWEWLFEHGIDPDRIITEENSLTTGENAMFTAKILLDDYPQIKKIAVVSSDYHVPLGCIVFQTEFLLLSYISGEAPLTVISNAAYRAGYPARGSVSEQASYIWKLTEYAGIY